MTATIDGVSHGGLSAPGESHRGNGFRLPLTLRATCRLVLGMIAVVAASSYSTARGAETVDYLRDVKPLLKKRCYDCHGVMQPRARLRLDTARLIRKGGDGGPAIEEGQSRESLLLERISATDDTRMPPPGEGEALSAEEFGKIAGWIDQGAPVPADEPEQPDPRKHWSFQAPKRSEIPSGEALGPLAAWVGNPVDAFLAVEYRNHGLTPRPRAEPAELIRRLYLDLIGLAPSIDAVRAFVADPSERAYADLVERLLGSPQYGERWGRHWMDVWRYSDWDGYKAEIRESQPHIWRWRDWIVEALNEDRPYDEMVVAMLAADEQTPDDPRELRATGYLVRNWYKFNRNSWLDATVEHTAKAFLGITLNCARCHDHKYDPFRQTEYYAFRAFFEPHAVRTDYVPGQPDTTKDGLVRVYDSDLDAPTYLFERGDERKPLKEKSIAPAVPRVLQSQARLPEIGPVSLSPAVYYPALNAEVRSLELARADKKVADQRAAVAKAEAALAAAKDEKTSARAKSSVALFTMALRIAEAQTEALRAKGPADDARYAVPPRPDEEVRMLARAAARADRRVALLRAEETVLKGDVNLATAEAALMARPDDDAAKKAVEEAVARRDEARKLADSARQALDQEETAYAPLGALYPSISSSRRLALARWITDRNNPLTARVAVNHLWMRHFGAPLVASVFDFGVNGTPPWNAALLDWLAVRFMESGWSMKDMHRLLVTSSAYQMSSSSGGREDPNRKADPANVFLWRMNSRRLEAEAVRDNLLHVSGNLDQTMGGPDLAPETGLTSARRSLYFRHSKEKRMTFLQVFDSANVVACYRRSESVVPQQALALANSPLSREQARLLARKLSDAIAVETQAGPGAAFVAAAFEQVLGRSPTPEEQVACETYLREQADRLADTTSLTTFSSGPEIAVKPATEPAQRARENLVHVLLNHHDFVTIR